MSDMGRKRKESWMGGAEFAEIRESLGYTQTEFAKLLDVTSTAISHYEIERTPIPKVLMLLVKAMKSGKITTK